MSESVEEYEEWGYGEYPLSSVWWENPQVDQYEPSDSLLENFEWYEVLEEKEEKSV